MNNKKMRALLALALLVLGNAEANAADLNCEKPGCFQLLRERIFSCFERVGGFTTEQEKLFNDSDEFWLGGEVDSLSALFLEIKGYEHVPVRTQIARYNEIYRKYPTINDGIIHVPELFEILLNSGFTLWKSYIETRGLEKRRKESLLLLNLLLNLAVTHNNQHRLSPLVFWRINVLASVIIDWHKGEIKGVKRGSSEQPSSILYPSLKFLFERLSSIDAPDWSFLSRSLWAGLVEEATLIYSDNAANEITDEAFDSGTLFPLIIYTNCSSSLSQETFLNILLKQPRIMISVFDCDLFVVTNRYSPQEKYLAHNGLLSTSGFLYHDLHHALDPEGVLFWPSLVKPIYNLYGTEDLANPEHKKILEDAAFFMVHEVGNLISYFTDDVRLKGFKLYKEIGKEWQKNSLTMLGSALEKLRFTMPIVASRNSSLVWYQDENNNIVQVVEEYDNNIYKFKMRDWELMLHNGLPKPAKAKELDALKFTYLPKKDIAGNPLLPSLESLLQKAYAEDPTIYLDPARTKIEQWKMVPKTLKHNIKRAAIKNAYERFWSSVMALLLERNPSLVIKEDYLPAYQDFVLGKKPEEIGNTDLSEKIRQVSDDLSSLGDLRH
jgi:hypothetical protein